MSVGPEWGLSRSFRECLYHFKPDSNPVSYFEHGERFPCRFILKIALGNNVGVEQEKVEYGLDQEFVTRRWPCCIDVGPVLQVACRPGPAWLKFLPCERSSWFGIIWGLANRKCSLIFGPCCGMFVHREIPLYLQRQSDFHIARHCDIGIQLYLPS